MTDSERSYVTPEDVINLIDAAYKQPGLDDPLRRVLNEMIERELGVELESFTLEALQGEIEKRMLAATEEAHPNG